MALVGRRLAVAIPDSVLEEKGTYREKTTKLGTIARACAIYGVDVIEIFRDQAGRGEGEWIRRILEYLETPQYLRRRLYPLDESLRYAGALPPLRIPSHKAKIPVERLQKGEVREGVTNGDGTVDIGLDAAPRLVGKAQPGRRLTVKISSLNPLSAEPIARAQVREYWGYTVETRSPGEVISDQRFALRIATSRLGAPLGSAMAGVRASFRRAGSVKMIFGSPSRGLFEIIGRDLPARVDFVLNLFPQQEVETVRTEEAIFAGLGLLGFLSAEKA